MTGCIATGKTALMNILKRRGENTINCDEIASKVFKQKENEIFLALGNKILKNGKISKKKTSDLIFSDPKSKKQLEKIMHKQIYIEVIKKLLWYFVSNNSIVYIEIPLFFELGLEKYFDSIVVYVDKETQIERMKQRDGDKNIENKIRYQMNMDEKVKYGTYVIKNYYLNEMEEQIEKLNIKGTKMTTYLIIVIFLVILISKNN